MIDSQAQNVKVNLPRREYSIHIEPGCLDRVGPLVRAAVDAIHAVTIADSNVELIYGQRVGASLQGAGLRTNRIVVQAGEATKSVAQADRLWQQLIGLGTDRKSVICALGGGVVGDLAGFVAATFSRGVPFVQIPTTVMAQVDSSVGGKTAVNLPQAKNMVGVFWQPAAVVIDPQTLTTLPDREYRSGLAEVVKYGVILDADFFAFLEQNVEAIEQRDSQTLRGVIARCCRLKADVVEADERETTGLRAILNYGHTFGHAVEATTGYGAFLHGEAVSIGMMCAARLAERLGMWDAESVRRQRTLLEALRLPVRLEQGDRQRLVEAMRHDKKVEHGRLKLILPAAIGRVERVEAPEESLLAEAFEIG